MNLARTDLVVVLAVIALGGVCVWGGELSVGQVFGVAGRIWWPACCCRLGILYYTARPDI